MSVHTGEVHTSLIPEHLQHIQPLTEPIGDLTIRRYMGDGQAVTESPGCALTRRHFLLQDDRPDQLREIDIAELDPVLRCLLFTDGTVTRTLEVQALSRITVEVVSQTRAPALDGLAQCLEMPHGMEVLRRRAVLGANAPVMWAESHIFPGRLPTQFLDVLRNAPDGIGQSLQQLQLECLRDMLWFGLGALPEWSEPDQGSERTALTRLYRVVTRNRPALLISESFAVRQRAGVYQLDWTV